MRVCMHMLCISVCVCVCFLHMHLTCVCCCMFDWGAEWACQAVTWSGAAGVCFMSFQLPIDSEARHECIVNTASTL